MLEYLRCVICGKYYSVDVPTWIDVTANVNTCPYCGSTDYVESDIICEEAK